MLSQDAQIDSPNYQDEELWEEGVAAIVRAGSYANRQEVLAEAFHLFLLAHPNLRLGMAIQLYLDDVVTLARAAELADLNFFDFQAILRSRGISIESPQETADEIEQGMALILGT